MRSSKYTRAVLAPVVAASTSLAEVIRRLGLRPTGGNHRFIAARIRPAGLDVTRFERTTIASRVAEIPREVLQAHVRNLRFLCPNCHSQTGTYCRPRRRSV